MMIDRTMDIDIEFARMALAEAETAFLAGEVPVGAVVVERGEVIARAHNKPIGEKDPTAHAEILALRAAASRLGNYRLPEATLYVTLEPCLMCVGAILQARIARLVFGVRDPKGGAVVSLYRLAEDRRLNHTFQIREGVLARECGEILRRFFREKRQKE